jgi:hypothetical protein
MLRSFAPCLLVLLALTPPSRAQSLEGTWRQDTPGLGESDWILTANGDGTYEAQEHGLGSVHGTARLKNNVLTIAFDHLGAAGIYEWKLNGKAGTGSMMFTKYPDGFDVGVERVRGGKKVRFLERSTVKLLPPPSSLVVVYKDNTPGIGESVWTLVKNGPDTFRAVESGLGNGSGTARLKDNVLTIHWKGNDDEGFWEWKLNGKAGTGALIFTHGNLPGGVVRERNGQKVLAFDKSTVEQLTIEADPDAPARFTLPVKLQGQKTEAWCFAASTQMILNYNGTRVSQGELLNVFTGRKDCGQVPTPGPCITGGGEPQLFDHFHYTLEFRHGPLTPEEIVREIYTRRQPFNFGWDLKGGGSHSLVAIGYAKVKGGFLVEVLDPSPVGSGAHYFCTYQQWLEDGGHVYQDSIFNISRPKKK